MRVAVKVAVFEYRRGSGGRKLNDWIVCDSVKTALKFQEEFNLRDLKENVPDWGMLCEGDLQPIDLTDEQFKVLSSDRGLPYDSVKGGHRWLSNLQEVV